MIYGFLPQKGAPFQFFPLFFFLHFLPLLLAHWGTSLIVTGGDYFSTCCLEYRLWQEGWQIVPHGTEWFWILVLSAIFSFSTDSRKWGKDLVYSIKDKICGKYAVHFAENVGKVFDKPVDTEGKWHWNEQYLKIIGTVALQ